MSIGKPLESWLVSQMARLRSKRMRTKRWTPSLTGQAKALKRSSGRFVNKGNLNQPQISPVFGATHANSSHSRPSYSFLEQLRKMLISIKDSNSLPPPIPTFSDLSSVNRQRLFPVALKMRKADNLFHSP